MAPTPGLQFSSHTQLVKLKELQRSRISLGLGGDEQQATQDIDARNGMNWFKTALRAIADGTKKVFSLFDVGKLAEDKIDHIMAFAEEVAKDDSRTRAAFEDVFTTAKKELNLPGTSRAYKKFADNHPKSDVKVSSSGVFEKISNVIGVARSFVSPIRTLVRGLGTIVGETQITPVMDSPTDVEDVIMGAQSLGPQACDRLQAANNTVQTIVPGVSFPNRDGKFPDVPIGPLGPSQAWTNGEMNKFADRSNRVDQHRLRVKSYLPENLMLMTACDLVRSSDKFLATDGVAYISSYPDKIKCYSGHSPYADAPGLMMYPKTTLMGSPYNLPEDVFVSDDACHVLFTHDNTVDEQKCLECMHSPVYALISFKISFDTSPDSIVTPAAFYGHPARQEPVFCISKGTTSTDNDDVKWRVTSRGRAICTYVNMDADEPVLRDSSWVVEMPLHFSSAIVVFQGDGELVVTDVTIRYRAEPSVADDTRSKFLLNSVPQDLTLPFGLCIGLVFDMGGPTGLEIQRIWRSIYSAIGDVFHVWVQYMRTDPHFECLLHSVVGQAIAYDVKVLDNLPESKSKTRVNEILYDALSTLPDWMMTNSPLYSVSDTHYGRLMFANDILNMFLHSMDDPGFTAYLSEQSDMALSGTSNAMFSLAETIALHKRYVLATWRDKGQTGLAYAMMPTVLPASVSKMIRANVVESNGEGRIGTSIETSAETLNLPRRFESAEIKLRTIPDVPEKDFAHGTKFLQHPTVWAEDRDGMSAEVDTVQV